MIGGIIALVIGLVVSWIYFTYKAIKDPDVQVAADLRMSVAKYRKMIHVYEHEKDCFHNGNNRLEDETIRASLVTLKPKRDEDWEKLIKSKIVQGDLKLRYSIGHPLCVILEENNSIVDGVIVGFSYGVDWGYIVDFETEIGIDNCFPRKQHILSQRMVDMIVACQIKGSDVHYVF